MPQAAIPLSHEPRFLLDRIGSAAADFGRDVRDGLSSARKSLPPRWFYDEIGSALFEAICRLPEYYVTRTEAEILTSRCGEITAAFGSDIRLVELGSGTARKTRILLDALAARNAVVEYVPVDVDARTLARTGRELVAEHDRLRVHAICGDFVRPSLPLEVLPPRRGRTVVLFLGSTIGNLDPAEATAMLRDLRGSLAAGDALLLGVDLRKARDILEPAYDDALGVTAAFNRNILARINRELGGHFELDAFRHHAFYDERHGRIEMHLESTRAQRIAIDALQLDIAFTEGESIHTESSYKHDEATLSALAASSGFTIDRRWTDEREWFADVLMIAS